MNAPLATGRSRLAKMALPRITAWEGFFMPVTSHGRTHPEAYSRPRRH